MKKLLFVAMLASLLTATTSLHAQTRRPTASSRGAFSGISGGTVAVGVGVVAAIAAIALIANNSSNTSHAH